MSLYNLCVIRILAAIVMLVGTSSLAAELNLNVALIMRGRPGTAVIVDVSSARILASYHLAAASRLLERPGSAIKPFTLLALLQSGKLRASDSLVCRRNLHVGGHDLSCSHPETGPLQAVSALAYSCNDFFATFGLRLTAEELRAAFAQAGLSSPTGLVRDEAVGSIRLANSDDERQLQAVGEEDLKVTPLEMLAAYRKLALRRGASDISDAERVVAGGLEAAADYGMARQAAVVGLRIAGKTGTPRSNQGAWTNAWFAGYAPADKPEIAIVVFLEKGTGPADAAALAGQIINAWNKGRQR